MSDETTADEAEASDLAPSRPKKKIAPELIVAGLAVLGMLVVGVVMLAGGGSSDSDRIESADQNEASGESQDAVSAQVSSTLARRPAPTTTTRAVATTTTNAETTTTPPTTTVPTTSSPAPTTSAPGASQAAVDCDGSWLTVVASAALVNVELELNSNFGSSVLRTDEACQSLSPTFRSGTHAGQPIYVIFYGPFSSRFAAQEQCVDLGRLTIDECYAAPLTNDPADRSVRFGPFD